MKRILYFLEINIFYFYKETYFKMFHDLKKKLEEKFKKIPKLPKDPIGMNE
jgi:hypothetical protein